MGLVQNGKAYLYVTNFDGEKNQTGGTSNPFISLGPTTTATTAPLYKSCSAADDSHYYSTFDLLKNLRLYAVSASRTFDERDRTISTFTDNVLFPIYKNCYNVSNETISYQNPVILCLVATFQNISIASRSIYGIAMLGEATESRPGQAGSLTFLLGYEMFDNSIALQPNDTITFTMIVK